MTRPDGWTVSLPWQPEQAQSRKIPAQIDAGGDVSVAIGGIGAGAITRGVNGGFTRWSLKAGRLHVQEWPENGFALWHGPGTARALRPGADDAPQGWRFDPEGKQCALFPRVTHEYLAGDLTLRIDQLAPVLPDLGDERDLPAGLFRVTLTNNGAAPTEAAVMLSFLNLIGWFQGFGPPGQHAGIAGQWNRDIADGDLRGVLMSRDAAEMDEGEGQMVIAARETENWQLSTCPAFDPGREGAAFWARFDRDGTLDAPGPGWTSGGGFSEFPPPRPCGAIAAKTALAAGQTRQIDLVLAWDMPVICFGQGRRHLRHYTAKWGGDGQNAAAIAAHALTRANLWFDAAAQFHARAVSEIAAPAPVAHLAINELYLMNDGLTVWTAPQDGEPAHFGIIECPDYPLYDTLDLWVYASAAVSRFFPDIAAQVTGDFIAQLPVEDAEQRFHLRSTARFPRQLADMAPHDLGAPNADPFIRSNDYAYQDSSRWKDLNAMLVICAWRDIRQDHSLAAKWAEPLHRAMSALSRFDRDGDCVIENDGIPDQTFDNIPMKGISAYCGGLWLAAARALSEISRIAGDELRRDAWLDMATRGAKAWHQALWTGSYYRVDSEGAFQDAVFAEQLYGPGLARMLGLGDLVPVEAAQSALRVVHDRNFRAAGQGRGVMAMSSATHSSAIYAPKGEEGLQWDEVLVGFNYSVAATMRAYGLTAEAAEIMQALAQELGPRRGLHFRTPAALMADQPRIRAQMNMRPMGIWAYADAAEGEPKLADILPLGAV
ncbi:GH116 family glycosyl hydrolase [Paracoccus sp. SCSIO 75233]|uniref:GH116 family glycosyl hydrolase n=1 Tax=Paracoccus sp. SCSIO 75233 TaxID=3017782 RepID=UPI0022F131A5|nr:GH116 family glycosyl hydrolase [Paracoccus sp. SCSIO 75233]WBU54534.1 GH116 family glycosyl hydrolase [Paracoccus sp. SCSIO 75233]